MPADQDDDEDGFLDKLRRGMGWYIGLIALAAWFVMLYLMFADVL